MEKVSIQYIGKTKKLELGGFWVPEPVIFEEKNNYTCTIPAKYASRLLKENPRSFEVVEICGNDQSDNGQGKSDQVSSTTAVSNKEQSSKTELENMTKAEIEKKALELFGVDLDLRKTKADLIDEFLQLQAKS